ncbi:LysR family transcriptional regulator [Paucibacter sp. XJ19-41]|uniref:LysR family transcriptional regulator n=1 Tax=Paucibacter sp. XJ19-41 TaxID=2927824 RepID=UPI0023499884|nr:LysR family transcriptional regulator [Paucibacter sp. XJ19-41]MDC6169855.1 LysR family transcriptional regulator [Paucibacter sp. XJ19-41]
MDQLRALRIFEQAARQGSFVGAARELDLSAVAVTRAVADLEAHLGARLFNRSTRRLALTEVGESYLNRARLVLHELAQADAMAQSASTTAVGCVRLRCTPSFAARLLAPALPVFLARHPGLTLEVSGDAPAGSAEADCDVTIVTSWTGDLSGDYVARHLASSYFIFCAAPDYLDRHGLPQTPEALTGHALLLHSVAVQWRELDLLRLRPRPGEAELCTIPMPSARLVTHQLELLYAAALAGQGITAIPSFVAAEALRDGRLRQVLPDWSAARLDFYAAYPSRQHLPMRTRVFIDFLLETLGGHEQDRWLPPA